MTVVTIALPKGRLADDTIAILERCGNNRTLASKQLGIGRTTLWRRYAEGEEERGI